MSEKIFLKELTLPITDEQTSEVKEVTYHFVQTDDELETAGDAADAKTTGEALNDLKGAIVSLTDADTFGYYELKKTDFEQGTYNSDGTKTDKSRFIRARQVYKIISGDKLITKASNNLYMGYYLLAADGTLLETNFVYSIYKPQMTNKEYVFAHDGYLYIIVGNGENEGSSTNITPNDFEDGKILVRNLYASRLDYKIQELNDETNDIYTKIVEEEEEETETKWIYYPIRFNPGQTYIVKLKFSAFTSSNNRKYSLRTTTFKYATSGYLVQMVTTVDGTNPTLNEEYTYRFVATERPVGSSTTYGPADYLCLELSITGETAFTIEVYSIKAEDTQTELDKLDFITATDIVSLNHDVPYLINNGSKPFDRATTQPFKLLHFSDIHAAGTNLQRIVDMKKSLDTLIDDTICTGDMASNNYSATCMDFWDAVDGAEDILMVVGNHDLADGQGGYSSDQIGQTVAYEKYFLPYISNWGVTMAGENLTYWYKDYSTKKVRLIGLNYLLTGDALTAQNTWLAARLAEAKTNNYAVVIAEHAPCGSFTNIDCGFTIIGKPLTYNELPSSIQETVQDFIDDDGEFACYIGGHSHRDYVGYNSNYPDQLFVIITTAQTTGLDNDQYRANGNKSQDAANVFFVDTVTKTVKLIRVGADMDCYLRGRHLFSINYQTKAVIADS